MKPRKMIFPFERGEHLSFQPLIFCELSIVAVINISNYNFRRHHQLGVDFPIGSIHVWYISLHLPSIYVKRR